MDYAEGVNQGRIGRREYELDDISRKVSNAASEVREGITNFVDGVKKKIPSDAVRKVSDTACEVTEQVRGYIEDRGIRGLTDDVTDIIRRYPMPALLCGVLFGVFLARPRGD